MVTALQALVGSSKATSALESAASPNPQTKRRAVRGPKAVKARSRRNMKSP